MELLEKKQKTKKPKVELSVINLKMFQKEFTIIRQPKLLVGANVIAVSDHEY